MIYSDWRYLCEASATSAQEACFIADKESSTTVTLKLPAGFTGKATTGYQYTAALKSQFIAQIYDHKTSPLDDPPIYEY